MRALDRFGLPPSDLVLGLQLLWGLPGFLRHPVRPAEARAVLANRLAQREATFLALMRRAVYASSVSVYQPLLRHAGCTYDDLVRLVTADGVEGALAALARAGVYLTGDELRGRRPVARGSLRVTVTPAAIRNPSARPVVPLQSSGSRGPRRRGGLDLRFMRDVNVNLALVLEARGARDWQHGIWGVPGGAELTRLLRYGGVGAMPVRWFTQLAETAPDLPPSYRWGPRVLRWAGRLAGGGDAAVLGARDRRGRGVRSLAGVALPRPHVPRYVRHLGAALGVGPGQPGTG